jgi:hypothetical protein
MARLVTTGFESRRYGTVAQCGEAQGVFSSGTVTADQEKQWDGSTCAKCAAGGDNLVGIERSTTALATTYYFQSAMRIASGTVTSNTSIVNVFAAVSISIELQTNGKLSLWNNQTSSNVLTEFFTPEREKTYLYDFKVLVPAAGNSTVAVQIRNEAGEVKYESGDKSIVFGNTKPTFFEAGHKGGDTAVAVYVSHLLLNDSTGSDETSWAGYQKVSLLKPKSDSSRAGFTTGAGGTTNLFAAVDNYPPVGVANGSKTAESQIYSAVSNTTDFYEAFTSSYQQTVAEGGGGLIPSDAPKAFMAIARGANSSVTSRNLALKSGANPAIGETTKGTGTTAAGTEPTGWTSVATVTRYPSEIGSVERSNGAWIVVRKGTASTDALAYDMIGLYVSYEPIPPKTVEVKAALTGTGSLKAAATASKVIAAKAALTGTGTLSAKATTVRPVIEALEGSSVLDSLQRTENPLSNSGKWSTYWNWAGPGIVTSTGWEPNEESSRGAVWASGGAGVPSYARVTLSALALFNLSSAALTLANVGGTAPSLRLDFSPLKNYPSGPELGHKLILYRVAAAKLTELANVTLTLAVNDTLAIAYYEGLVRAYRKPAAGEWTELMSASTSAEGLGDLAGILGYSEKGTFKLTNFSAGHIGVNTVEAKAALTGSSSLSAQLTRTRLAKATLSASSSLAAKATATRLLKASLTGTGALSVSAARVRDIRASLTGTGSLSAILTASKTPPPPPAPWAISTTVALEVFDRSGHKFRFGPEEEQVSRTLLGHSFNTAATGGYGAGNFEVTAPSKHEPFVAGEFYGVRLYIVETNETLYAGRVTGTPQSGTNSISIETEGWINSLGDNQTASEIFIDRALDNWGEGSTARKIAVNAIGVYDYTKSSFTTGFTGSTNTPAIFVEFSAFGAGVNEITEVFYRSPVELGQVKYDYITPKPGGSINGTMYATNDDVTSVIIATGSTHGITAAANQTLSIGAGAKYLFIQMTYTGEYVGLSAGDTYGWSNIRVRGRHGLTAAGSGLSEGFLLSDLSAYIVGRWGPLLYFTTGQGGTVEPTTLPVNQAAFREDTTAWEMLKALQIYGGNADAVLDVGCYGHDGKEFYMRSAPYGKEWIVRSEGDEANAVPSFAGPDSSQFINGIKILYDPDGSGQKKSIGPVGSGADIQSAVFEDTALSNPANADGSKHWAVRDIGINSREMAEAVAFKEMAYRNSQDWRGSITVKGEVEDAAGNLFPAGMMRGGDTITVVDDEDPTPRRIESSSNQALEVSVDIGAPPDKISVMLARAELAQQGRIAS